MAQSLSRRYPIENAIQPIWRENVLKRGTYRNATRNPFHETIVHVSEYDRIYPLLKPKHLVYDRLSRPHFKTHTRASYKRPALRNYHLDDTLK